MVEKCMSCYLAAHIRQIHAFHLNIFCSFILDIEV